jgi:PRTRC genetic system protein A
MALHAADAALFAATPLLPVPRFGSLPPLLSGAKRLLGARDGLYVEARTTAWDVCLALARTAMPYGDQQTRLRCPAGPVPLALLRAFIERARATPEQEVAAAIVVDADGEGFSLMWPPIQSASAGHVRYIDTDVDDDRLVVDLHSHGRLSAFFSETDHASDLSRRGPYLALVVGECDRTEPTLVARMVLPPYLVPIDLPSLKALQVFA